MATIVFDDELDGELAKYVPGEMRGDKKVTLRAHYVAREWLRERRRESERRESSVPQQTVAQE